jgi:two-component system nitrogen regulation response regulator GlnG
MASKPIVWIIDDDRSIRWVLEKALAKENFDLRTFDRAEGVIEQLTRTTPDAIISDIRMPGMDGLALLEKIQAFHVHRVYLKFP